MFTVRLLRASMLAQEALIFSESSFIARMVCSTTCLPSSAWWLASDAWCEASAALRAISWAAAPSSLIAAATLLVRLDCSSELAIEEFEAFTTSCATSCSWRAVPATSRIDSWIRSTKRLKALANVPNSSLLVTRRRLVRSPSPWAMSCMARPMSVSGCISTRISMPRRSMMPTTAISVATIAEVRNSLSIE